MNQHILSLAICRSRGINKVYNKSRRRKGIQVEMVSSVFNSVFSLLASRNQQYKAVTTAVAHHIHICAHPVIILLLLIR